MQDDELDRLIDPALSISDGFSVDWSRIEAELPEADRAALRQLRLLEELAALHQHEDPAEPSAHGDEALHASIGTWGHLELRARIGSGGFGDVYRAWEKPLQRDVALKLLDPQKLRRKQASNDMTAHVLREGRLMARVRHPNIVTVHGVEEHDGRVGIWMEFVHGHTLEDQLQYSGPLGAREAALVGLDLCRAVSAVHQAGIVHGDIKAKNVMRESGGRILLMDFGAGMGLQDVDRSERVSGTLVYMAPEVLDGAQLSPQSDLYALGVLLYHLVTGEYPLLGKDRDDMRGAHARGEIRLLREARTNLPEAFVVVVERALETDPARRFASAGHMEQALAATLGVAMERITAQPTSKRGRKKSLALVGFALAIVLAVASGLVVRRDRPTASEAAALRTAAVAGGSFTAEAVLCRVFGDRLRPLGSSSVVTKGDGLSMQFTASDSVYLYIVAEDEQGEVNLLFPLPDFDTTNPLAAGTQYRLPGTRHGQNFDWVVTNGGGRMQILIVASRERVGEFEDDMQTLMQREGALRGTSGLRARTELPVGEDRARRLFELAGKVGASGESVHGVWVRQIDLDCLSR